jgi:hypothetical protein
VRCLIKLKRTAEAIKDAESLLKRRRDDGKLLVLAHASAGDVKQTIAALEKLPTRSYLLSDCYQDQDLGPILRSDAFRELRVKFPEPKHRPRPIDDESD